MQEQLFDEKMGFVKRYFDDLLNSPVLNVNDIIRERRGEKISGIYVFSEGFLNKERFLYVGQANNIFNRLKEHCALKNTNKANFAYKLAVELTNLKPIPNTPDSTKAKILNNPEFYRGFESSVLRIKNMNYRWISVDDKLEKNLLEIYASVILCSKFNNFD